MQRPRARILFLINSLETGGAERQLALTVANLDRDRFEPVVCTLFRGGPHAAEVEAAGVRTKELGLPKNLRGAIRGAHRAVAEVEPGLVHTAVFEANVAGRLAAGRAGVPVVSHATSLYESDLRYAESTAPAWKLRAARAVERWSARRSRAEIVAVGRAVAESARAYLRIPPERLTVIRRGFDFGALEAAAERGPEAPAWPGHASPRLLAVGRLAPPKGFRFLIEALPSIREHHPDVHLAVAGAGPLDQELRALADRVGVGDAVTFLGVRHDVPALMRGADVFVLPSLWEGAAGALVEATGLGVPVACSELAPLLEVTGFAAATFPVKDPSAIAREVLAVAADLDAARARAAAAVHGVRDAHDIVRNTRALERLYDRVLGA
ncbi:MAG TPA: glycosyltransferase [Actinomycetota bacterium]